MPIGQARKLVWHLHGSRLKSGTCCPGRDSLSGHLWSWYSRRRPTLKFFSGIGLGPSVQTRSGRRKAWWGAVPHLSRWWASSPRPHLRTHLRVVGVPWDSCWLFFSCYSIFFYVLFSSICLRRSIAPQLKKSLQCSEWMPGGMTLLWSLGANPPPRCRFLLDNT